MAGYCPVTLHTTRTRTGLQAQASASPTFEAGGSHCHSHAHPLAHFLHRPVGEFLLDACQVCTTHDVLTPPRYPHFSAPFRWCFWFPPLRVPTAHPCVIHTLGGDCVWRPGGAWARGRRREGGGRGMGHGGGGLGSAGPRPSASRAPRRVPYGTGMAVTAWSTPAPSPGADSVAVECNEREDLFGLDLSDRKER